MGATSTRMLMDDIYCDSEHDKHNWKYYSGDRFTVIPNYYYSRQTEDEDEEEEEQHGWWDWHWLL